MATVLRTTERPTWVEQGRSSSAARALILAVLLCAAPAAADHPREQGLTVGLTAGGGGFIDGGAAPAIQYGIDLAWVIGHGARVAFGLEIDGAASWRTSRHDRGAVSLLLAIWPSDRFSFSLGAGTPVGPGTDMAVGDGIAGFVRFGYDLVHWSHSALVLRFGVDGDNTPGNAGLQAAVTIGIDVFGLGNRLPSQ